MHQVGKRQPGPVWKRFDALQKLVIELRKGKPFIPKGVHRFKTFQEAQQWSLQQMSR
jgi:hypothetical protein